MSDWREALHAKHGIPECGPIEVGDGWRSLVESAYNLLPPCMRVAQVKEKYGTLRVYVDHDLEHVDCALYWTVWPNMEHLLMEVSARTCEVCGGYGQPRGGGWVKTLCDEHADGRPLVDWSEA